MDIYGNNIKGMGGVINASEALFTIAWPGFSGAASLVQGVQISYSIEYRDLYELGSGSQYFIKGRPRGQMTIGSIVGGQEVYFGDPCNPATINIGGLPSACGGLKTKPLNVTLHNAVVVDYGIQVSVEDMLIRQNMVFKFTQLSEG